MTAGPSAAAQPLIQATLLGDALDGARLAVFVADDELRYVAVSRFAAEMLGYSREELLGLRVTDVARSPKAPREYEELVSDGRREGTAVLTRKDGDEIEFRYIATETRLAGMPLYLSVGVPENGYPTGTS